tara:strand:+ start:2909 stop:3484 length:576 start_codon:yes stop_codon:yes gene_type:complete
MIESPSDFRWQYLSKFPVDIINELITTFLSEFSEEDIRTKPSEVGHVRDDYARMFKRKIKIDSSLIQNECLFIISDPHSGIYNIHTDKSRNYSLNFPIRVDREKGCFLSGYHKQYKYYDWKESVAVKGMETNRFNYTEKDFEKVPLDQPIILNTKIPHSWMNESADHRIIGSLSLKEKELDKALSAVKDWM